MQIARAVFFVFSLGFAIHVGAQPSDLRPDAAKARRVRFVGLRRVPENTLRSRLKLPTGNSLHSRDVRSAVETLHRSGWFASVRVELRASPDAPDHAREEFVFVLEEQPFVAGIEYRGSRLLDPPRIETLLREAEALPSLARPVDPLALHRAAEIIRSELQERGHADARVVVREEHAGEGSLRAIFEITDGPCLPVHNVSISGGPDFSAKALRNQMREIRPGSWFAGLRNKNVYTEEKLAADADHIERYLHNHGHPFAQTGVAHTGRVSVSSWAWWPFPRRRIENKLEITLPVATGPRVTWDSVAMFDCEGRTRDELLLAESQWRPGEPYSVEKLHRLKTGLAQALKCGDSRAEVQATPTIDRGLGTAHVEFRAVPAEAFRIGRIEFNGHHRFPERFYRRRLALIESDEYSEEKLQQGLAAVARGGFVERPATEDVALHFHPETRVVDVRIRVREAGRQRISLVGGASTVGMAYNLFNLLGGEELLTGYLEGGPANLQVALSIARDGLLGNRAALGFSLFHNVLRPRLPGGRGEKLFTSKATGVSQSLSFYHTPRGAASLQYQFSSNSLEIPATVSTGVAGQGAHFSNSEVTTSWERNTGSTRVSTTAGVAGGWLGGQQDLWRTGSEAAILRPDLLSNGRNHWAARVSSEGVFDAPWSSGVGLPLHARLYSGSELVRGLRPGELATRQGSGLNLVHGASVEYRVPLDAQSNRLVLAAFADGAVGWLMPGATTPRDAAGSVSRAALGLELQWRLPEGRDGRAFPLAGETLRIHYAFVPWLRKGLSRRSAWGWALASLF